MSLSRTKRPPPTARYALTTFTLVHLSDLHITSPGGAGLWSYWNKRASGWLSWKLRREGLYKREVLESLFADLQGAPWDHVVITGDLTNLSLEHEFREALPWLQRLGEPSTVTVVPGNHDSYVQVPSKESWDHWLPYMTSDTDCGSNSLLEFPFVRVRGPVALIGLSSAVPTPPFDATGTLGAPQLFRLEALLGRLGEQGLCRIVLIHHPPVDPPAERRRRRLRDSAALATVLRRQGAELVLYGHLHDGGAARLAGPGDATIPALGVSAASCAGRRAERRARYHRIRIDAAGPPEQAALRRHRLHVETRVYDVESGRFRAESDEVL